MKNKDKKRTCHWCGEEMKQPCRHAAQAMLCPFRKESIWQRIIKVLYSLNPFVKRKDIVNTKD